MYTWGLGEGGRLGHGDGQDQWFPVLVECLSQLALGGGRGAGGKRHLRVTEVVAGGHHTLAVVSEKTVDSQFEAEAVRRDGVVYSWGGGGFGKLGHGGTDNEWSPAQVAALDPDRLLSQGVGSVVSVEAGEQHSLAITTLGRVFMWGQGSQGRLGLGSENDEHSPVMLSGPGVSDLCIVRASCGTHHTLAITDTGDVYLWGVALTPDALSSARVDAQKRSRGLYI